MLKKRLNMMKNEMKEKDKFVLKILWRETSRCWIYKGTSIAKFLWAAQTNMVILRGTLW